MKMVELLVVKIIEHGMGQAIIVMMPFVDARMVVESEQMEQPVVPMENLGTDRGILMRISQFADVRVAEHQRMEFVAAGLMSGIVVLVITNM